MRIALKYRKATVWALAACMSMSAPPCFPQKSNRQNTAAQTLNMFALTEENLRATTMLVRIFVIALDQANNTGNYSVFHSLTAPVIRNNFSVSDFSDLYAPLRFRKLQLGAAAIADVKLAKAPYSDPDGFLHIEGALETKPKPVPFKLVLLKFNDRWQLMALGLDMNFDAPAGTQGGNAKSAVPQSEPADNNRLSAKPNQAADRPGATTSLGFAGITANGIVAGSFDEKSSARSWAPTQAKP